jgi:hypothetical protein
MEAAVQPVETSQATIARPDAGHVEAESHQGDERFVLIVGFAIGMMIAGVFLVYIVLAAADLLK